MFSGLLLRGPFISGIWGPTPSSIPFYPMSKGNYLPMFLNFDQKDWKLNQQEQLDIQIKLPQSKLRNTLIPKINGPGRSFLGASIFLISFYFPRHQSFAAIIIMFSGLLLRGPFISGIWGPPPIFDTILSDVKRKLSANVLELWSGRLKVESPRATQHTNKITTLKIKKYSDTRNKRPGPVISRGQYFSHFFLFSPTHIVRCDHSNVLGPPFARAVYFGDLRPPLPP